MWMISVAPSPMAWTPRTLSGLPVEEHLQQTHVRRRPSDPWRARRTSTARPRTGSASRVSCLFGGTDHRDLGDRVDAVGQEVGEASGRRRRTWSTSPAAPAPSRSRRAPGTRSRRPRRRCAARRSGIPASTAIRPRSSAASPAAGRFRQVGVRLAPDRVEQGVAVHFFPALERRDDPRPRVRPDRDDLLAEAERRAALTHEIDRAPR